MFRFFRKKKKVIFHEHRPPVTPFHWQLYEVKDRRNEKMRSLIKDMDMFAPAKHIVFSEDIEKQKEATRKRLREEVYRLEREDLGFEQLMRKINFN